MAETRTDVTTDASERQLERHGYPAFPVAFYQGDLVSNRVVWHWHEEMELILIAHGRATVGAGGLSAELTAGEGCFIRAGALHNLWKTDAAPCVYRSVVFHPRLIGSRDSVFWLSCVRPLEAQPVPPLICFAGGEGARLADPFARLWTAQEEGQPGYENEVRYRLTGILRVLAETSAANPGQLSPRETRDMERMKAMLSFLEEHYGEELTLKDIAESAAVSETECMRCFRRSVGSSPVRFLKEYRLQKAAGLLRSTAWSISEIAAACGFFDMSYFTKSFRKLYHQTPTAYRNGGR